MLYCGVMDLKLMKICQSVILVENYQVRLLHFGQDQQITKGVSYLCWLEFQRRAPQIGYQSKHINYNQISFSTLEYQTEIFLNWFSSSFKTENLLFHFLQDLYNSSILSCYFESSILSWSFSVRFEASQSYSFCTMSVSSLIVACCCWLFYCRLRNIYCSFLFKRLCSS